MDARQRAYGFACARAASHPGHALSSDALVSPIHFSNSPSRSRGAFFAPGFCFVASLHPDRRVAERRETYGCSDTRGPALDAAGQAPWRGALRPMTRDARLPALHRGDFRLRSRASLTGICAGSVTASSSRPGRSARLAGSRASRDSGYESLPQDATPRSAFGIVSGDAPR